MQKWECKSEGQKSGASPPQDPRFRRHCVRAPKSSHFTPIRRSLHWLKITEPSVLTIEYKLFSLTYKVLYTTTQPSLNYLHNLITVHPPRSTRSSSLVTLARPSTSSSLRITDRSFQYASTCLWNRLLASLRQPRTRPLISPILTHRVLWVALYTVPLIGLGKSEYSTGPSTHHSHHPSPAHSFIPGLKPSFSVNPSHRSLPFFFGTDCMDSRDCLPIFLSISVIIWKKFPLFSFWFHAVD